MLTLLRNSVLKLAFLMVISLPNTNYAQEGTFTRSVIGMTELIKAESVLIKELTTFIANMEKKIKQMQKILDELKLEHDIAQLDAETYLGNPLRSFALIRRLHSDWIHYEHYISDNTIDLYDVISSYNLILPNDNDLLEAAKSIKRLQSTYDLKAEDMAAGLLNGIWYNSNFTVQDTFAIGLKLFENNQISEAIPWFNISLCTPFDYKLYEDVFLIDQKEIYVTYIKALLLKNHLTEASTVIKTALALYPNELEFFDLMHDLVMQLREDIAEEQTMAKPSTQESRKHVCRGYYKPNPSFLHCHYFSDANAFTFLAPFKLEELSLEPYIALYYNIVSDDEIDELKEFSASKLQPARLAHQNYKLPEARTAKLAWLGNEDSETIERINQRIADMTGFNLNTSDSLQILNYGLGGYFGTHFNTPRQEDYEQTPSTNDRRATVIIYLSDIEQGGNTVFPKLEIEVKPLKGQAILWYNIDNNGFYNNDTAYIACPVLVGSKWILTKWIHDHDTFHLGSGPIYHMPSSHDYFNKSIIYL